MASCRIQLFLLFFTLISFHSAFADEIQVGLSSMNGAIKTHDHQPEPEPQSQVEGDENPDGSSKKKKVIHAHSVIKTHHSEQEPAQGPQFPAEEDENKDGSDGIGRKKRTISSSDQTSIVNTFNALRSLVGASNMPYLSWNFDLQTIASMWTSYCNYDSGLSSAIDFYGYRMISSYPSDIVTNMTSAFNYPDFYLVLRSTYLTSIAADIQYCSTVTYEGAVYNGDYYLQLFIFTYSSAFNDTSVQYTIGEACTDCLSGSYWCDYGLCRSDCSILQPNCYCYPYCFNCAGWDGVSCTCQCLTGWTGPRCQIQMPFATTPPCVTYQRTTFSTTPWMTRTTPWLTSSSSRMMRSFSVFIFIAAAMLFIK